MRHLFRLFALPDTVPDTPKHTLWPPQTVCLTISNILFDIFNTPLSPSETLYLSLTNWLSDNYDNPQNTRIFCPSDFRNDFRGHSRNSKRPENWLVIAIRRMLRRNVKDEGYGYFSVSFTIEWCHLYSCKRQLWLHYKRKAAQTKMPVPLSSYIYSDFAKLLLMHTLSISRSVSPVRRVSQERFYLCACAVGKQRRCLLVPVSVHLCWLALSRHLMARALFSAASIFAR